MISKKGYQPDGTEEVFVVSCVVPEIVYTYRVKEVDNTPVWGSHFTNKTCKKYKCLMKPGIKMTRFEAQDNKVLAQWHRWPDKYNSWVDKKVIQNA